VGAASVDRKYHLFEELHFQTSNPSRVVETPGGVACNVARNAARLGLDVALASCIGDDAQGVVLRAALHAAGVDVSLLHSVPGARTAEYAAIIDTQGELIAGVCDAAIVESFSVTDLRRNRRQLAGAGWVFADCNLSAAVLAELLKLSRTDGFKLAVDGVSEAKVRRLPEDLRAIDLLFLNESEAASYLGALEAAPDALRDAALLQARGAAAVVLTLGECGLVVADSAISMVPPVAVRCVDVTGAGDALIAGTLYGLLSGENVRGAARTGALLAAMTIESPSTVLPDLTPAMLEERRSKIAAH
jgi:pseudouridine kinase